MRASIAVAAIFSIVVVPSLTFVNYEPHFKAPYGADTLSRLTNTLATISMVRGPLLAGFGMARLTPTLNAAIENPERGEFKQLPLAGFGNRKGKPAEGVHDDVFVKAVSLRVSNKTVVMITADALIIPREVAGAAAAELKRSSGLNREEIYFGATHTHSSIGGWGEGIVAEAFSGGYQPGARAWFANQLALAAKSSLANLRPASAGSTTLHLPQFVRNRLVGSKGRVDDALSLLVLRQDGGNTAVLGAYAAHATVLGGSNMRFSADYPGSWQREMETNGISMALFFAGAVGSHGPVAGGSGYKPADAMGKAMASTALKEIQDIPMTNHIVFLSMGLEVDLPQPHVRLADQWRLRPFISRHLLPVGQRTLLQAFRIGNSIWMSTPCDFSGEIAIPIRESLLSRGFQCAITSFNGDYIGYVIPGRYYHLNSYESRTMSFFGPTMPDYFEDLLRRMADGLAVSF